MYLKYCENNNLDVIRNVLVIIFRPNVLKPFIGILEYFFHSLSTERLAQDAFTYNLVNVLSIVITMMTL